MTIITARVQVETPQPTPKKWTFQPSRPNWALANWPTSVYIFCSAQLSKLPWGSMWLGCINFTMKSFLESHVEDDGSTRHSILSSTHSYVFHQLRRLPEFLWHAHCGGGKQCLLSHLLSDSCHMLLFPKPVVACASLSMSFSQHSFCFLTLIFVLSLCH